MKCKKEREITVKELVITMKKMRKRGLRPYLKAKKGYVKIEFD